MMMAGHATYFALANAQGIHLHSLTQDVYNALCQRATQLAFKGNNWEATATTLRVVRGFAVAVQAYVDATHRVASTLMAHTATKGGKPEPTLAKLTERQATLDALFEAATAGTSELTRQRLVNLYMAWRDGLTQGMTTCLDNLQDALTKKPTTGLLRLWHQNMKAAFRPPRVSAPAAPPTRHGGSAGPQTAKGGAVKAGAKSGADVFYGPLGFGVPEKATSKV